MNKPPNNFQSKNVLTISFAHLIHDIYTSFLAPMQTIIIEKIGITHTLFGMLSVFQRIPSLLNPFVGIVAEKFKIRYFLILSPSITAISMSLIGIAPGYIFLVILMLISGLSSTLFHVPTPVMIKQISGDKTGKGMGFYMFGGELARTIGPVIITGAVDLFGFEGSFKLIPMGFLSSIILFTRFKNVEIRKNSEKEKHTSRYVSTLLKFLPLYSSIFGILLTRGAMKSALTFYLPRFMDLTGHSMWISTAALSIVQLSGAAGTFFSGTISDTIGRKQIFLIISVASPILMWLFILINIKLLTFPLLLINGLFLLAPTPVLLALIHDLDTKHLPFLNGVYMTGNFFISSLMTFLVGYGFDMIGHELTFKIAACIAFIAIPIVIRLKI